MVTGTAMRCRLELAELMRKHGIVPPAFTPPPLLPHTDGDLIVEGYCSPASIDRERMRFAPVAGVPSSKTRRCSTSTKPISPLAGSLSFAPRSRLIRQSSGHTCGGETLSQLQICSATVHDYEIVDADDRDRVHALIVDSTLEEITMDNSNPVHPLAVVTKRSRAGSLDAYLDGLNAYAATRLHFFDFRGTPSKRPARS